MTEKSKNITKFTLNKQISQSQVTDASLKKLDKISDENIDYSDIPELDETFWEQAKVIYPSKKKQITLRIDQEILDFFQSKGQGYQTRINAVLKSYVSAKKCRR